VKRAAPFGERERKVRAWICEGSEVMVAKINL